MISFFQTNEIVQLWQAFIVWWMPIDKAIEEFIYFYPLFMAYIWMFGAIIFCIRFEWRNVSKLSSAQSQAIYPPVSILIPCYNEGENVRETIGILQQQQYPHFEIIAINDGSKDNTLEILHELAEQYSNLRVLNLDTNQGKAMGLKTAALLANYEFLICIDGDALLAPEAVTWMIRHFLENPNVGAVTGMK